MINEDLFDLLLVSVYVFLALLACMYGAAVISGRRFNEQINRVLIIIVLGLFFVLFGFRNSNVGADTKVYYYLYDQFSDMPISLDYISSDIGFIIFVKLVSIFGLDYFLPLCSFLYLLPIAYVLLKTKASNKFILLFCLLSQFYFVSLGINIMRQGIALSMIILSLYFYRKERFNLVLFYQLLAVSFHSSVILVPVLFYLCKRCISLKYSLYILLGTVIISIFGLTIISKLVNIDVLNGFYESRLAQYVESDNDLGYKIGFRYDFFLFNLFFLVIGYRFVKKENEYLSGFYILILKTYILLTSIFVLMFNFPYSDRFGVLSWVFIPYILSPFITNKALTKKYILPFVFFNILIFFLF